MKKNIALILAATTLILSGCSTTRNTWEYKEVSSLTEMNALCKTDWRLVSIVRHAGSSDTFLLKHKIKRP